MSLTTPAKDLSLRAMKTLNTRKLRTYLFSAVMIVFGASPMLVHGATVQTVTLSANPNGLTSDGTNVWAALGLADSVAKIRASDGVIIGYLSRWAFPRAADFRWRQYLG